MEIKNKTAYLIVFWSFVITTILCYVWGFYSLVRWIINLF